MVNTNKNDPTETLTAAVKKRSLELGRNAVFSSAFSDAVEERLAAVGTNLNELVAAMGIKSLTGKHVAYAWRHVSLRAPAAKKGKKSVTTGGNPGVTLPSEYFGVDSYSYYPLATVQPFEASVAPTSNATRPEMSMKEIIVVAEQQYGGSSANFVSESLMSSWLSSAVPGAKLNRESVRAMVDLSNTFGAVLMARALARNKNTPVALIKFARTV